MRHIIILLALFLLFLNSCTEDLDFDYHTVAPLPVIEGYVDDGGARVVISRTREVTDSARNHYVDDARVTVTDPDGRSVALESEGRGVYTSAALRPREGQVYSLSVTFDGRTFEASDTVGVAPADPVGAFVWERVMGQDCVSFRFAVMTPPDSMTYYVTAMLRNGEVYRWGTFNSYTQEDGYVDGRYLCFNTDDMEGKKGSSPENVLHDGDRIEVYFAGVTKKSYEYFMALDMSGSTCANPSWAFKGQALGVFAARNVARMRPFTFHTDSVLTSLDLTLPH